MSNKLVCPICGDVTSSYMGNYRKDRLCKKHATDLRNGKLVKCENCNEWHYVNESCKCKKTIFTELPTGGFNKCVACGAETTGYAFCKKCFSNYTEEKMLEMLNKSSKENVEFGESAAIERQRQEDGKCIVCGEDAPNGSLCRDCYYEMLDYKDTFDKNAKVFELKDYYLALSQQMVDF